MRTLHRGQWCQGGLLAIVLFFLAGCGNEGGQSRGGWNMGNAVTPAVEAVEARLGSLPLEERLSGQVVAHNQTEIYPEVSGIITEIFVENGEAVEAGDPLVQLRDAEYRERLQQAEAGLRIAQARTRQAEANLQLLRSQLKRMQEMINRGLETSANLETIQSQVEVAEADLQLRNAEEVQSRSVVEERRIQLVNTTIRAPIKGQVGQRNAEIGQLATTSTRLFVVGDLDRIRVEMLLTENMLTYIQPGMPVNLYSENYPGLLLDAEVTRISPFLDPATMRTQAQVELKNPDNLLRPGMFVSVDVFYGESEQAVLVPNSALYRDPRTGIEGVYVVQKPGPETAPLSQNERAGEISAPLPVRFVPITVVASGRMASGVEGIDNGAWVVTVGQHLLEGNVPEARTRVISWEWIMELQTRESRDLFEVIESFQQARAATTGDS